MGERERYRESERERVLQRVRKGHGRDMGSGGNEMHEVNEGGRRVNNGGARQGQSKWYKETQMDGQN